MTKEREQRPVINPPSHLRLFQYDEEALTTSRRFANDLAMLEKASDTNREHWASKQTEVSQVLEKLRTSIVDAEEANRPNASSVTVGMTYLKFLDKFLPQGRTEEEIFGLFRQCLRINTLIYAIGREPQNLTVEQIFLRRKSKDYVSKRLNPLYRDAARDIPAWFRGSKDQYILFLKDYSPFGEPLNPEMSAPSEKEKLLLVKRTMQAINKGERSSVIYGETVPNGLPDWLLDDNGEPQRSVVEEELARDKEEVKALVGHAQSSRRQYTYLETTYNDRLARSEDWIAEQWHLITPGKIEFGDLFIYIHGLSNYPEKNMRTAIEDEDTLYNGEMLSLWVEDIFNTSRIIEDGKFTTEGITTLDDFLAAIMPQANDEERTKFRSLQTRDKNAYNVLNYDLGPFIRQLQEDEIGLMRALQVKPDEIADSLIRFTGDSIAKLLKEKGHSRSTEPSFKKAYDTYKRFHRQFFRNHWQWGYGEYMKKLFPIDSQLATPIQKVAILSGEPTILSDDLETAIEGVREDGLSGWKVVYALDRTLNERSFVEIEGQSIEEKGKFFGELCNQESITCSIKKESVLRALAWKVQTPQEVEYLAHRKEVGEVVWKKMKRGAVRIFYRIFPQDKTVVFFVHQKQDWSYGF